jgi:hypothetical protein
VASKENVSCALGDETAILDMRTSKYYGLDPVGARIWKLPDQRKSVKELRAAILEEFEAVRIGRRNEEHCAEGETLRTSPASN